MKLTVIGTGYVGLVSGVCLAKLGAEVTCVDKDAAKIARLEAGQSPIYEPGLDELMQETRSAGRLHFTTQLEAAIASADIIMIAVGTPPDPSEEGKADLRYVFAAAEELAPHLSGYSVVVTKSTVPVGSNEQVARRIAKAAPDADFDVASNPEFLREGSAIGDFMQPDRIVVGCESTQAAALMAQLYAPLTKQGYALLQTDLRTAEMIKYASNSYLAARIAFINEMADLCENVGADVEQVAKGMGMDARIGARFLRAGPGYGGSCFPKDTQALAHMARESGSDASIIRTVIDSNAARREQMAQRIIHACGGSVSGKTIAILGLTFKANTDDMRESPALTILPRLQEAGAQLRAFDPEGMQNAKAELSAEGITYCESALKACEGSDAAVIITEWAEFAKIDLAAIKKALRVPCLIDLRNLFLPQNVAAAGFDYHSIGRAPALGAKAST